MIVNQLMVRKNKILLISNIYVWSQVLGSGLLRLFWLKRRGHEQFNKPYNRLHCLALNCCLGTLIWTPYPKAKQQRYLTSRSATVLCAFKALLRSGAVEMYLTVSGVFLVQIIPSVHVSCSASCHCQTLRTSRACSRSSDTSQRISLCSQASASGRHPSTSSPHWPWNASVGSRLLDHLP